MPRAQPLPAYRQLDVRAQATAKPPAASPSRTIMEKVRVVLNGLPPDQQKSLQLAFFEGLSHSEIAAQTGDPLGTIKTRIRTALISVRKAIQA